MSLYKYSEAAQIAITAAFCLLVIADLVGNSLVCLVVLCNKVMRTPMNYLLVNLAISDMTVAVFIAARYIFILMFVHPSGKIGDLVCQLVTGEAFVWVGAMASVFSLVCIALERYLAIKFPYDERKRITTTKLKRLVVLGWFIAVAWNMPLFLYARYDPVSAFCLFPWPTPNFAQYHSVACAFMYGVLPVSIMVYLYSKLVYKLWIRPVVTSSMVQKSKLTYRKKSARLVVTVSVIYAVCWAPVLIIYVFTSYSSEQLYSAIHTGAIVLVTLNSAINPVLYSLQSERFRRHMLALLPRVCCRKRCHRVKDGNYVPSADKVSSNTSSRTRVFFVSRGPTA